VFDESKLYGTVLDAKLQAFNPSGGFSSDKPTETYGLFDVTTPLSQLEATNFGRIDIFNDLGTGTQYGSQTVSSADNGKLVTVNLDAAAVAGLSAKFGSQFAVGGALTSANGPGLEYLFGFSGSPTDTRQLVLTVAQPNFYKVSADGNSMLQIDTGIPAFGSGQFVNDLVSGLNLYDPSGNLVATASGSSADGTASLKYKVPKNAGGTYYIEVDALGSTAGEYILSIKGASSPSSTSSAASLTAAPAAPAAPADPTAAPAAPADPTSTTAASAAISAAPTNPIVRGIEPNPIPASAGSISQDPIYIAAVDQALATLNPTDQDPMNLASDWLLARRRRSH
jgi:Bacterial pre-peptidase C-terminal domain